jgi:hypothetical protein
MNMIAGSILLGFTIFLVDFIVYGFFLIFKTTPLEKRDFIPISLFIQVFFALIFVFTFRFLAILKALNPSVSGGLYFAYIMFLPMLYMLFNNMLWINGKKTSTYLNILIWGIKLCLCGLITPLI